MRKLLVLALVTVGLAGCGDTTYNCPQSLGVDRMSSVEVVPMPVSPPRPPAPRPPVPRAPSAPKPAAPKPAAPKVSAPKPPPRYIPPPRNYRPPLYAPPAQIVHHQTVYVNNHHDPMPYLWMTMAYSSALHEQQVPEGCNR
jgi:hypothetical protein